MSDRVGITILYYGGRLVVRGSIGGWVLGLFVVKWNCTVKAVLAKKGETVHFHESSKGLLCKGYSDSDRDKNALYGVNGPP